MEAERGGVIQQAMAVDSGVADYVLVYRAFNGLGIDSEQGQGLTKADIDVSFS